jgi:hypothetical protein
MATKRARARARARAARWMATPTKRKRVRVARGMAGRGLAMATLMADNKKCNGKSGDRQWLQQRGWCVFDGGNNGGGVKDTTLMLQLEKGG